MSFKEQKTACRIHEHVMTSAMEPWLGFGVSPWTLSCSWWRQMAWIRRRRARSHTMLKKCWACRIAATVSRRGSALYRNSMRVMSFQRFSKVVREEWPFELNLHELLTHLDTGWSEGFATYVTWKLAGQELHAIGLGSNSVGPAMGL